MAPYPTRATDRRRVAPTIRRHRAPPLSASSPPVPSPEAEDPRSDATLTGGPSVLSVPKRRDLPCRCGAQPRTTRRRRTRLSRGVARTRRRAVTRIHRPGRRVGIGTLYRHFPTRQDLVAAVYGSELDAVLASVDDLLAAHDARSGLGRSRRGTRLRVDEARAGEVVRTAAIRSAAQTVQTRARMNAAIARFLERGAVDGTLRSDLSADDVTAALVGVLLGARDRRATRSRSSACSTSSSRDSRPAETHAPASWLGGGPGPAPAVSRAARTASGGTARPGRPRPRRRVQ